MFDFHITCIIFILFHQLKTYIFHFMAKIYFIFNLFFDIFLSFCSLNGKNCIMWTLCNHVYRIQYID